MLCHAGVFPLWCHLISSDSFGARTIAVRLRLRSPARAMTRYRPGACFRVGPDHNHDNMFVIYALDVTLEQLPVSSSPSSSQP